MSLPSLTNWEATAQSLHKAAQMLGVIRMVRLPHVPNYLEMALKVKPEGVSTDVLPGGSEVTLDFQQARFVVRHGSMAPATVPLAGHSQVSLLKALLKELQKGELADLLKDASEDGLLDKFLAAAAAAGHDLSSPHNEITGTASLNVDASIGRDYSEALYRIFTGVARFRARLNGSMTPAVIWPGHFDLSFLWFATAHTEENAPHMNFGFAPYGGGIETPYLYVYAYPMPANSDNANKLPALPAPAYWHLEGWKGVVVRYPEIAKAADPEGYIEGLCEGIYRALRPLLG